MIKYAANATLASQIMIANDIYRICRALGINYDLVKKVMQLDERIGRNMDVPGNDGDFGFGGKCFPKDLCALIHLAREYLVEPHVLAEVWRSNLEAREKKDWLGIPGATSSNKDFT
jgi:UDPglucose 6-dehydrogenase